MIATKICPKCGVEGEVKEVFGLRIKPMTGETYPQSWCKACRIPTFKTQPHFTYTSDSKVAWSKEYIAARYAEEYRGDRTRRSIPTKVSKLEKKLGVKIQVI